MGEYKTFMPTEKMLEELKCRLIYRDGNDLEKDLHKQKMLIMFMNHKMIPADRTEFHKFYNEYYFELGYYARLIFNREELWFKGQVEHYLKTKEPSYGVDLPANEFMTDDFDEKAEATSLIGRVFETMMIQQLRGPLDYEKQHEEWYDRYNELQGDLSWFDEELTKIAHAVLLRDFESYIYDLYEENDCQCGAQECDAAEEESVEEETAEEKKITEEGTSEEESVEEEPAEEKTTECNIKDYDKYKDYDTDE